MSCISRLACVSRTIDICIVAIKNIINTHAVLANQIADILQINDKEKYLHFTRNHDWPMSHWATESLLLVFIMADFARIIYIISIFMNHINPIQNGGRGKMATLPVFPL